MQDKLDSEIRNAVKSNIKDWRKNGRNIWGIRLMYTSRRSADLVKEWLDRYYPDVPYVLMAPEFDYKDNPFDFNLDPGVNDIIVIHKKEIGR